MEPLISIRLRGPQRRFQPGDLLHCEYQVDGVDPSQVQAIEASVLWFSEGKGDEDLGVHYFERHVVGDSVSGGFCARRLLETQLPNSPLSYAGAIVKIRWCVRVRVFLRRDKEYREETPFYLGSVPRGTAVAWPYSEGSEAGDAAADGTRDGERQDDET